MQPGSFDEPYEVNERISSNKQAYLEENHRLFTEKSPLLITSAGPQVMKFCEDVAFCIGFVAVMLSSASSVTEARITCST
jgi:hypothetical protein